MSISGKSITSSHSDKGNWEYPTQFLKLEAVQQAQQKMGFNFGVGLHVAKEYVAKGPGMLEKVRDSLEPFILQQVENFKNGPTQFIKNIRNFATFEILPSVLVTIGAVVGATLLPRYIYESYKHAIGRPKLAIRERQATGAIHAVTSTISALWNKIMGRNPALTMAPIFNAELTRRVEEFVQAICCTVKNKGFFQNILFYGPGGVGKTMIAEKIAMDANVNFVMMSGGDLAQYIKRGEHVTELNKLFNRAESSSKPTIIFIDEAEGLCLDRNIPQSPERIELLNTFLNRTGTQSKKIILIMATNRKEDFDEAVLSRMDHKVAVGLPEMPQRVEIITKYLPQFFDATTIKTMFTKPAINIIAEKTNGFTGRALFKMLNVMLGKKTSSADNKLTPPMIAQTVSDFAAQEALENKGQASSHRMTRGLGASVKGHATAPAA